MPRGNQRPRRPAGPREDRLRKQPVGIGSPSRLRRDAGFAERLKTPPRSSPDPWHCAPPSCGSLCRLGDQSHHDQIRAHHGHMLKADRDERDRRRFLIAGVDQVFGSLSHFLRIRLK
jgi:hypothetical protein